MFYNIFTTFLIVGKHAVLEALKNPSRKIERVFLTEDAQKKLNRENQNLNLFNNIAVFYKSKRELDNLCGKDETAHQGFVAEVGFYNFIGFIGVDVLV